MEYYKSIILKKVKGGEYNSALEKVRSALILLQEHQNSFNIKKELLYFSELNNEIKRERSTNRLRYERRLNNLLHENLTVSNLENFSKLLAMLKSDVDHNLENYNLEYVHSKITKYFKYIKKLYEILSCYKTLNYYDVSEKIFSFVKEVKTEYFPNLIVLVSSIYQDLLSYRLYLFSNEYEKLSISTLSKKMAINQDKLVDFIYYIQKLPKSPVKSYNSMTNEIIFQKL
ncbi:MAG: hypothetical protein ACFFEN_17055 [Candidatus Thorarchaeota archaeon]